MRRYLAAFVMSIPILAFANGHCSGTSGDKVVPLVELYSSEGCDSCPPADRWLSALARSGRADVNLVALHVDYWDRLGWQDRFGSPAHTRRQEWLARGGPSSFVYTPEVFVAGRELRGWSRPAFDDALKTLQSQPAAARLRVDANAIGGLIKARTTVSIDAAINEPRLVVALLEDGLSSQIGAGENRGVTLHHDRVLRAWSQSNTITEKTIAIDSELAIPTDANAARLSLVAWIEDGRSGRVAQSLALSLRECAR